MVDSRSEGGARAAAGERPAAGRRGGVEWSRRATAKDVAAIAGVSAQTVSRVANGAHNVNPDTRERVLHAMAKVGYRPNGAARTLRSGHSAVLGLVTHHIARTGEANIAEAVATTAHDRGYAVSLAHAPSGAVEDLNLAIAQVNQDVAGLVVLGMEAADLDRLVVPAHTPVVIADSRPLSLPAVGFDQAGGARLAVTHLLGLGHATVHLVSGPTESPQACQRLAGWTSSLEAAGRAVPEPLAGDWTPASGYAAGRVLAEDPAATAVLCANDEMAAGVMRALHEAGRRIPDDVSVVGFDDIVAEYLWPPLTSVRQDFRGIGARLVETLLAQIDRGDRDPLARSVDVGAAVEPTLAVRASTAPPRRS